MIRKKGKNEAVEWLHAKGRKRGRKRGGRIVIFQEARSEVEKVLKSIIKKGVFHRRG